MSLADISVILEGIISTLKDLCIDKRLTEMEKAVYL